MLDGYFGLSAHATSVRTEMLAETTTLLTMVHIVFVNPAILQVIAAAFVVKFAVP